MKPLAVSLTGISKSSNTSVSYFLFWHNQSSKLSRHDRIWQVPRTLAKIDKEKAEGSHFGFSLPISLVSYVFGKCLFWKRVLCPMSNITYSRNTLWSILSSCTSRACWISTASCNKAQCRRSLQFHQEFLLADILFFFASPNLKRFEMMASLAGCLSNFYTTGFL